MIINIKSWESATEIFNSKKRITNLYTLFYFISVGVKFMTKISMSVITLSIALLPGISLATGTTCIPTGSYTMNITTATGAKSYGVFEIHADRTLTSHHSFNLTQKYQGPDHVGGYATIQVGVWKSVSSRVFKIVNTCVDLARNPTNPADPAVPVSREKGTATFTFNNDCKSGTFTGQIEVFAIPSGDDNLALTGAPIATVPITGNFQKLSLP